MALPAVNLNLAALSCPITFDRLLKDKRRIDYVCPNCHQITGAHRSEGAPAAVPAAAAAPAVAKGPQWEYHKIFSLVKSVRWTKSAHERQNSRLFFSRLNVQLAPFKAFQDTEFVTLLPSMIEDPSSASWALDNLVNAVPALTWSQVMERFSKHFDTADIRQETRREYEHCRMKASETAQEFTTRFLHLTSLLGYDAAGQQERAVEEMIDRLQPELQSRFLMLKTQMLHSGGPSVASDLTSLHFVTKSLIEISLTLSSNSSRGREQHVQHIAGGSSRKRAASSEAGDDENKTALQCKYHPNATSHSTENCRKRSSSSSSRTPMKSAFGAPTRMETRSSSVNKSRDAVCYHCNESGHIKPNCPQLNKSGLGNSSDSASLRAGFSGKLGPASMAKTPTQRGPLTASMQVRGGQEHAPEDESASDS